MIKDALQIFMYLGLYSLLALIPGVIVIEYLVGF